jgi:hypothetical protein
MNLTVSAGEEQQNTGMVAVGHHGVLLNGTINLGMHCKVFWIRSSG